MQEVAIVDLSSRRLSDHDVALTHHVEEFLQVLRRLKLVFGGHECPLMRPTLRHAMPKIDVNQVAEILKRNKVDPALLRQVVEEMNLLADAAAQADDEKPPAVKKQFVILVSDPEDRFPKNDFAGWILQIPENESVATTQERIFKAAYDFNASKKGRLLPVKTIGEAMESIPAKHFKEADVWVKTKTPVLVLTTNNEIPKDSDSTKSARRHRLE